MISPKALTPWLPSAGLLASFLDLAGRQSGLDDTLENLQLVVQIHCESVGLAVLICVLANHQAVIVDAEYSSYDRSRDVDFAVLAIPQQEAMSLKIVTFAGSIGVNAHHVSPLVDPTDSGTRGARAGKVDCSEITRLDSDVTVNAVVSVRANVADEHLFVVHR